MKEVKICGRHIAYFRGFDNKAYAVHAYCPHMGANLGFGGKVKNTRCIEYNLNLNIGAHFTVGGSMDKQENVYKVTALIQKRLPSANTMISIIWSIRMVILNR